MSCLSDKQGPVTLLSTALVTSGSAYCPGTGCGTRALGIHSLCRAIQPYLNYEENYNHSKHPSFVVKASQREVFWFSEVLHICKSTKRNGNAENLFSSPPRLPNAPSSFSLKVKIQHSSPEALAPISNIHCRGKDNFKARLSSYPAARHHKAITARMKGRTG